MKEAYKLRNAVVHGDDDVLAAPVTLLDGGTTEKIDVVVADLMRVMRRASHLVSKEVAS